MFSVQAQKFAFVDTDYILSKIPEYNDAQAQIDDLSAQWQNEMEAIYAEVNNLYQEYQAKKAIYPEEVRAKKEAEIKRREKISEMKHEHGAACPGSKMMQFRQNDTENTQVSPARSVSRLGQWPCQIKLVPPRAPFFDGAKLLIAADCTAYAYANMHEDFMRGKITIIGCPKLDAVDYTDKLTEIIRDNDIKSVTIVRMEVPCCGGLQRAAENALRSSGKFIPWQVVTISRDGKILD